MPPVIIAAIIGAAATAGTTAFNAVNSGNQADDAQKAQQAALAQQQQQFAQQQALQQQQQQTQSKAAITQQLPDLQAQLGGTVAPDYFAQVAASQTGNGNQIGLAQQLAQQYFGQQGGGGAGLGLPQIQSLLQGQQGSSGGLSGGNVTGGALPYDPRSGLTNGGPV